MLSDLMEILKAFTGSPVLSQFICITIVVLTILFYRILKKGLSTLDASVKRIADYLSNLPRDSGADPHVAEKIRMLFQEEPRLYHHWQEYFESVATEHVDAQVYLKATQAASKYFSFDNLVHAIDWKRFKFDFFGAIPGILTGLGLLGTFAGLVTGLPEGENAELKNIANNIGPFLHHMRGAFVASMLGVFCGLLFNTLERVARDKVQSHCIELCNLVDQLFPRRTDQSILNDIRNHSEKQLAEFKNLALDIGNEVARGIVGSATANLKIDEGLKEGVAKGFGMLANTLIEFVDVQKSFITSMTEMQSVQKQIADTFSSIQASAKDTGDQVQAASNSIGLASGVLNSVSEKLADIVKAINGVVEVQSGTAKTLGETSSSVLTNVNQLIGQQNEMLTKFKNSVDSWDLANKNFDENLNKYHNQHHAALSNSLRSFDGALSGAVEKLDSGIGNLNVLMNDFVEKIDQVKP